ncbi:hypothetical protein F5883DRAFT_543241, partial [Diaporthe sp. PMI_573]
MCSVVSRAVGESVAVAIALLLAVGCILLRRTLDAWHIGRGRLACPRGLCPLVSLMRLVGAEDSVVCGQNQSCG